MVGRVARARNNRRANKNFRLKAMKTMKAVKKTIVLKKPSASTNRNRTCGQCGRRIDRCRCHLQKPVRGTLHKRRFGAFQGFLRADDRRRFLTDCLDVRMVVAWITSMSCKGMCTEMLLLAVAAFRHFNRVSTWKLLKPCFKLGRSSPDWNVLHYNLHSSSRGLHKAFSRPVTCFDQWGYPVGVDTVENAVIGLKAAWEHSSFKKAARLLNSVVGDVDQYKELMNSLDRLRSAIPGFLGTYRRKNWCDVLVAANMIKPSALAWYPVAACSGTQSSLCHLYGTKTSSEVVLSKLLNHLYCQLRKTDVGRSKAESLATLSLVLCGWSRHKNRCKHAGPCMSMLDRAILQETACGTTKPP